MCSIPGGEPESLENDDQLDPEVASYGLNRARAFPLLLLDSDSFNCIYSFTKRIKIFLIYDTIASTNCIQYMLHFLPLTYTSAAVVPSDPLITTTWYTGLVGDAL